MAQKAKGKKKVKKSNAPEPARKKATKKKAVKKKTTKKRTAKKTIQKKAVRKKAAKKLSPRAKPGTPPHKESVLIEPGPPSISLIPVEEPAANEEAIGTVTHYYSDLGVAVVQINKGALKAGNTIHVKGHTSDFSQQVESMEYEHQHVDQAFPGQAVGIKVIDHAREHDIVFLVK